MDDIPTNQWKYRCITMVDYYNAIPSAIIAFVIICTKVIMKIIYTILEFK